MDEMTQEQGPLTANDYFRRIFNPDNTFEDRMGWVKVMPTNAFATREDRTNHVAILMYIGDEREPEEFRASLSTFFSLSTAIISTNRELCVAELRAEARKMLVRHYANRECCGVLSDDTTWNLVEFFAADRRHCNFTARDLRRLQGFLMNAWTDVSKNIRTHGACVSTHTFARVLIFARCYAFLRKIALREAIPLLFEELCRKYDSDAQQRRIVDDRVLVDRCGSHAPTDVLRMIIVAGDALRHGLGIGNLDDHPESETARTLLALLAASAHYYADALLPDLASSVRASA
ncbi:MAG: hypothetical protein Q7S96_00895 [bacterium]|nr:hypothetical protein [bacterium]